MSVLPSSEARSVVVTRLRSAGCVFAEDEARLLISAARTPAELDALVERRIGGLPLEHVLGWVEFRGRRIAVDPGVFVPRRRTEFLVEQAIEHAEAALRRESRCAGPEPVVLDLCCGSGALGVAVAEALGPVELHATDIDPVAVRCARRNIAGVGGRAYLGDLYASLPPTLRGRVDILLANVPYVPTEAVALLPAEAREHEPRVALDGGTDGLDVARRVAADAPLWLAPGGCLLVEANQAQASTISDEFTGAGLAPRVAYSTEFDATVVTGTR